MVEEALASAGLQRGTTTISALGLIEGEGVLALSSLSTRRCTRTLLQITCLWLRYRTVVTGAVRTLPPCLDEEFKRGPVNLEVLWRCGV